MSNQDWKPGDTLNLGVTVVNPYKETRYLQAFQGGGYGVNPRENFHMTPRVAVHALGVRSKMEKDHQENISNLPDQILSELSINGVTSSAAVLNDSNSIKRDQLIIGELIRLKTERLQSSLKAANSFYGSDPHSKTEKQYIDTFNRYTKQHRGAGATNKHWVQSYLAGYSVKFYNESIRLLTQHSNQLQGAYTQALIREEAERHAEAQAREEATRQAEALERESAERNERNVNLPLLSGAETHARPLVVTPDGLIAGYERLPTSLGGALDVLEKAATAIGRGPLATLFATVFYSPDLGNGELQRYPVVLSMPLSQFASGDYTTLEASDSVSVPFRVTSTVRGEHTQLYLSPTGEALSDKVRVREAKFNSATGLYTFISEGLFPRTLTWTPNGAPGNETLGPTELPAESSEIKIYPGARVTPIEGRTDEHPACDGADTDDYILWFPKGSGIEPVYVMASRSGPRYEPGTVTGSGRIVGENWLESASKVGGAPIPSHIADQLRGKNFRNFDKFREKFWSAVAADSALSRRFGKADLKLLRGGAAPSVDSVDFAGKRDKFEIHHIKPIKEGGAVYDIDNLSIMTPKAHIDLHKNGSKP